MGAPVAAASAFAKTKAGSRVLILAIAVVILTNAVIMTPLLAIPLAIAGASASAPLIVGSGDPPAVSGYWAYPVSGTFSKGRGFGFNPVTGCSYCSTDHMGYDLSQGCGETIYAIGPGTVITADAYQGYGNTVRIDHGGGVTSLYGHMQWNSLRVTVGQDVTAGTPIGTEGNTGKSFGCHLHLEIRLNGVPIDPQPFMAARGLPLT